MRRLIAGTLAGLALLAGTAFANVEYPPQAKTVYRFENNLTRQTVEFSAGIYSGAVKVINYSDGGASAAWESGIKHYDLNHDWRWMLEETDTNEDGIITEDEAINYQVGLMLK